MTSGTVLDRLEPSGDEQDAIPLGEDGSRPGRFRHPNFEAMTMPPTNTELTEEVRNTHRELTDAIRELRGEVSTLRVEIAKINTSLNWAKGIGVILAGSAVTILILAFSVAHRATQLEDAVVALQKDSSQIKDAVVALQKDFGRTEGTIVALQGTFAEFKADFKARDKQIADSLDRIEKALAQTRLSKPARE